MASAKLFLVILTCLVAKSCAFWTACASGRPPINVTSPSCSGDQCNAVRGQNIILRVNSHFVEAHPALRPRAFVIIFGVPIQIPDDPNYADM